MRRLSLTLLIAASAALPAAERQFTYSQESNVLAPGQKEIEFATTQKYGREYYYRASQQRLELEVGIAPRLQAAIYLNVSAESSAKSGTVESTSSVDGWSGELKYQLSNAVADPFGSALYGELSVGAHETAVEGKLILDKALGDWLVVGNVITEMVQANDNEASHPEVEGAISLGISRQLGSGWSAGLELTQINEWVNEDGNGRYELEKSVLSAGPVVHVATESLWATATVLPQLTSFKHPEDASTNLDLDHAERWQFRVIVGTHF